MELIKITGSQVPIKALTQDKWEEVIQKTLIPELLSLLNVKLDTEKSAQNTFWVEAMIKENAWSLTAEDIRKAFLMYVKGQLSLEPVSNYLDAILFNKVIGEYKQTRDVSSQLAEPELKLTDEDKRENAVKNVLLAYDDFKEHGEVNSTYHTAFDTLYNGKILHQADESAGYAKWYENEQKRAWVKVHMYYKRKMQWCKENKLLNTREGQEMEKRWKETKSINDNEVQTNFKCHVITLFFQTKTKEELEQILKRI